MWAATISGQNMQIVSDICPLDTSIGKCYFPQIDRSASKVLVSPTDASWLGLVDLTTGEVTTVSDSGLPGFDARFGHDGKVYYVATERHEGNLLYRTGMCYDPKSGRTHQVLAPQHGQVVVVPTTKSTAIAGEHESYHLNKGTSVFARGNKLILTQKGKATALQPVKDCVGYLWASLSPKGDKIVFRASGKGLYVIDLQGNILATMGYYMMPSWLDNDHIVAMNGSNGIVHEHKGSVLVVLNADGSGVQEITDKDTEAIQPMVSGDKIVYTTKGGTVHIMTFKF